MELRVLQYFLAVTREQSISGAAEILELVQKTGKRLQTEYPDIHYHISSGNSTDVLESLDKDSPLADQKPELIYLPGKV